MAGTREHPTSASASASATARGRPRVLRAVVSVATLALAATSCAKEPEKPAFDPSSRVPPAADLAELEVRADGVDRFLVCPPPGALGQPWYPPPVAWTPSPPADGGAASPVVVDQDYIARTKDKTLGEIAIEATVRDFRACYRKGFVHDAAQDGRVAIVLRIGADGRVQRVEDYAACELSIESIACMKQVAARLRFPPPAGGAETVTIPAVFTSRDGVRRSAGSSNDAYTAGAYVVLEGARPGLHACEEGARREMRGVQATATVTMMLGADGKVTRAHVDPWTGDKSLLECAARELEKLRFAPPPTGTGTVIARLNFNPRQGTR